ncbi:MAG: thiol:disulfide interchange protein DsbA/DsbL [Burkholderiales bacterium]|nr:thiol:disulfide interchange protein DsbA/DsbL [Burkholderiales bacterium]
MVRWVKSLQWLAMGLMAASFSAGAQEQFAEGKDFLRLKNPVAVESGAKIEVIEFFSYGCPHCKDLEEYLGPWLKKVPADVSFKRVPVSFQPAWTNLGKIYYTLDALGREDLSVKVFQAYHSANVRLSEEKTFFDWAAGNGLDATKVKEMWASFAVNSKMNRAKTLASNYSVDSVPVIFVDGKFKVQATTAGGQGTIAHKNIPAAIEFLVAKARSERKK